MPYKDLQKRKEFYAKYREEHREEIRAWHREHYRQNVEADAEAAKIRRHEKYIKNKEHVLEQTKEYRKQHPEETKQRRRNYYAKNRDKMCEYHRNWGKNTLVGRAKRLYFNYARLDKELGVGECTLTREWIIENILSGQVCHWCGETDWRELGCDRIDNSKPHTPDNVVPSCKKCNNIRSAASYQFFKMLHSPVTVKIW